MTWNRFWKVADQSFDRLNTVALTLAILGLSNAVTVNNWLVFGCIITSFVGGLIAATCEDFTRPEPTPITN
jgi:hypothetical protein